MFLVFKKNSKNSYMVNAQQYLEQICPKNEREDVFSLDLSDQNLEGDLDLSTFPALLEVDISGNPKLGKIKSENKRLIIRNYIKAQE